MKCLNKNSVEYGDLKKVSNIPENILDIKCSAFEELHGRFPRLDEIQGSDSSKYLKEQLKVNSRNSVKTDKLLEFTGADSVPQAVINLNNKFLDLEISAVETEDNTILNITLRPSTSYKLLDKIYNPDEDLVKSSIINGLDSLRALYGYDIREVTSYELEQDVWNNLMPSNKLVNAFIYDGNIYINTDNADGESKIHEMLHLLFGTARFSNPELYVNLLKRVENVNPDLLKFKYPDRSRNDALEEYFVEELSKKLAGFESNLDNLTPEEFYEITYNVKRTLDTILKGDYSTKTISDKNLYGMSYLEVAKTVNSSKLSNDFKGMSMFDGSSLHRKLNNIKSQLLKSGDLTEICN